MFAMVLHIFWLEKTLEILLISTIDKIIYCLGTIFQGSKKPCFTTQNRVEISLKMVFYGHLEYFMAIWYIFGHFVYIEVVWYILWPFGIF
jgi:hypothetical protein